MTRSHRTAHLVIWLVLGLLLTVGLIWAVSLQTSDPEPRPNESLDDAIDATEGAP